MTPIVIRLTILFFFCVLAALPVKICGQTIYTIADGDVNGLINAINSSNASPGADVINLAAYGNYALTSVAEDDGYAGAAGLPYIKRPVTINGNGATIQRSSAAGVPDFRIIYVLLSDLTLNQVTIKGGRGGNVNRGGGGIGMIGSNLAIDGSTITENVNFGAGGGGIGSFASTFTIKNSTISYNFSDSGYGGGGIIDFASSTTSTIVSSTIFENRNIAGRGDAIANAFSTGTIVVKNSILASPTNGVSDDCYSTAGVLISQGHNIVSDGTCSLNGAGDMNNTNPLLGPLANNGGPTPTHALLSGGPAIDAIPLADCTTIAGVAISQDQRGLSRPFGSGCDIGAYESQVPTQVATTTVLTSNSPTTFGMDMVFTATVASASGVPTGSVEFYQDSIPIGSSPLVNGVAVLTRPSFNASTIGITAGYAGQGQFLASSDGITQVIQKATPTVTVTGGTFPYDGNARPATAVATGVHGEPVTINQMNIIYNPGGTTLPSNVGVYTVTANFVSGDSNYENASGSGTIKITDSTPPMIQPTILGTLGNNGWYVSDVTVTWDVTEPESTPMSTGCETKTVTTDTAGITFTCQASSMGGDSTHSVVIKRDATPPVISCGTADGAWHASDVSISCYANDAVSGLAPQSPSAFSLSTSTVAGTETNNAVTSSRQACDLAGNCGAAGPLTGNKIDKKGPTISISAPLSGEFLLHQSVAVGYICTDAGSGVATCSGSTPNNGALDTSSPGTKTFLINSTDSVGNTAVASVNYSVSFGLVALFDQTKANKAGSTVPIKVRLVDASGMNVSSAAIAVHAVSVFQTSNQASSTLDDAGNANPDFDFRYDAASASYIFNLKTTGYSTGSYQLNFVAGGGPNIYNVGFQIRQ